MPQTKCGFITGGGLHGRDLLVTHGPTLVVSIGFDPSYKVSSKVVPNLAANQLWALVDTGATESCIDVTLAKRLTLPVVDRRPVSGISGKQEVDVCLAQIHIPALNFTIYGPFAVVDLLGWRTAALSPYWENVSSAFRHGVRRAHWNRDPIDGITLDASYPLFSRVETRGSLESAGFSSG